MLWKVPDRESSSHLRIVAVAAIAACLAPCVPAQAEDLWDSVLERMNLKATPAAPGPDFVQRTRQSADDLGYLPTALPHKVSPLPVKKASEVEAQKVALDAAAKRQRDPGALAQPLALGKAKKGAKATPAAAAD